MDFTCAELLTLSNSFELFGLGFNYRNKINMSIRGRVTGAPGAESISGVWSGIYNYHQITGHQTVTINGHNFGNGIIKSISFDESTDVIYKRYNASIEILTTGDLWNMTGSYYSGIYGSGASSPNGPIFGPEDEYSIKYLNSFVEDISSSTINSGEFTKERSLSIGIDSAYTGSPATLFSGIYTKLFRFDPVATIYNALYPSYYSGDPITYENIVYNDTLREYKASQTFTYHTGNPWRWNYRHNIIQGADGIVNATEDGEITSSRLSGVSKIHYANIGYNQIESGIFSRLSGSYDYYINNTGDILNTGSCPNLVNFPTNNSINRNSLIGQINYSRSYTNNPAQQSGYIYSYANEINYNENGDITLSENGSLESINSVRPSGYDQIYTVYQTITPQISGRLNSLYTGNIGLFHTCSGDRFIKLESCDVTYKEYDQEIQYGYKYTDSLDLIDDDNYYSIRASYSNKKPTLTVGYFNLINDSEIAQRQQQSNPGEFINSITVIGTKNTSIEQYLNKAYEKVVIPSGSGTFLSDMSYSLQPNTNEFNMSMSYTYFEQIDKTETIL